MRNRRLIRCLFWLLLVTLPVQGFAAVLGKLGFAEVTAVAAASNRTSPESGMSAHRGHCHDGMPEQSAAKRDGTNDHNAPASATGKGCTHACCVAQMPPSGELVLHTLTRLSVSVTETAFSTPSFIPEQPSRPPRR